MKCALFFGSFNPLHVGHLAIAKFLLEKCDVDEVRLVVSPENPLKANKSLNGKESEYEARERLSAVKKAISGSGLELKVSDIEYSLPKPLYTARTLQALREKDPDTKFILVMGADNLSIMKIWFKWDEILSNYEVWVYPRQGYDVKSMAEEYNRMDPRFKVVPLEAPLCDISSTEIRNGEAEGRDMSEFKA
ncbi:MAG: nicotinate (nicotinamide) nucleotide adenylyltransferase [Bacteroidales bacterium]|jgi:nicotinate-nucleotide adenylyltransferase|nr:nicotinate (nicotinamide) nucleotide adenylyltransferase [Bacteroidales bacterium]MCI2122083.1 nicotinate (nicotinamide) nucleotide adenylyltransferase [Bacteroidales bacterium]MCI2146322.1 nicotinate (nicotinamide) nucleotide adenylyltransferase [Bacteroidales bacterium]